MPRHIVTPRRPFASACHGATSISGLLACLVVLSSAGCGNSHNVAEDQVMERAEQVAHETGQRATDSHNLEGWASNQTVLNRLVSQTEGERLASVVHNPDEDGVGLLATVEVVMVGQASEHWLGGEEVNYNICVRFEVHRETTGPREITPEAFDCPRDVPATRPPG
ncbi:hypothetical protein [Micromonospora sp. NPDC047187]|uniref:hypothetical protein n=1 Tax=Micromonospora sp. NPDC047187 TaxID=3155262 RepID=UPI0033C98F9D